MSRSTHVRAGQPGMRWPVEGPPSNPWIEGVLDRGNRDKAHEPLGRSDLDPSRSTAPKGAVGRRADDGTSEVRSLETRGLLQQGTSVSHDPPKRALLS